MIREEESVKILTKNIIGTTAEWEKANPKLPKSVWGFEETLKGGLLAKLGNGKDRWKDLKYFDSENIKGLPEKLQKHLLDFESYKKLLEDETDERKNADQSINDKLEAEITERQEADRLEAETRKNEDDKINIELITTNEIKANKHKNILQDNTKQVIDFPDWLAVIDGAIAGSQVVTANVTEGGEIYFDTDKTPSQVKDEITAKYDPLIPAQANPDNKLADKDFVNSSISNIAANRVTYTAAGEPFPTHESLTTATVFYHGGVEYIPTQNDYCNILSDEGAPHPWTGGQTRHKYSNGQWEFEFGINNEPFTAAENAAIQSGVTAAHVEKINNPDTEPTLDSENLITSGGVWAWFGAARSTLLTGVKTIIGAINELFESLKTHIEDSITHIIPAEREAWNENRLIFGVCSTAAGTVEKIVTIKNYTRNTSTIISVLFTTTNTTATPTLNINGLGAAQIRYNNAAAGYGHLKKNNTLQLQWDGTYYQVIKQNEFLESHDIGSIYLTVAANEISVTQMRDKHGGTWELWCKGRVPLGVGSSDANTDNSETGGVAVGAGQISKNAADIKGGNKTHVLTEAELAKHKHNFSNLKTGSPVWYYAAPTSNPNSMTIQTIETSEAGGDQPHNNIQPYQTCFFYKRTA